MKLKDLYYIREKATKMQDLIENEVKNLTEKDKEFEILRRIYTLSIMIYNKAQYNILKDFYDIHFNSSFFNKDSLKNFSFYYHLPDIDWKQKTELSLKIQNNQGVIIIYNFY